ncbi:MAG TPA: hypothetical protein VGM88_17905 [Kofleriaceae bacterium]
MRWPVVCLALAGAHLAAAQPAPVPPKLAAERAARAAAEGVCLAHDPGCDWLGTFSSLEQASLRRGLAKRGYIIDPSPWDKIVGAIHVYNEEPFAEPAAALHWINTFHRVTRQSAIRAESAIRVGELWDQKKIEETARILRDPLWSSVVAVIPVRSIDPTKVDVLIVTRDIFSLRLNTTYTFQEGSLTNLAISLSENNFLGHRDLFSLGMVMDQATIAAGPLFIDKSVFGEHVNLSVNYQRIVNRQDLLNDGTWTSEGSQSTIALSRPLWSLATEWSAGVTFTHHFAIDRQFLGTGVRTYDDPATPAMESVDRAYKIKTWSLSEFVTRQWGKHLKQQLSIGHTMTSQRPSLLPGFPDDPQLQADFIRDVFPRSEFISVPYVEYALFQPRYRTLRNVQTFSLAEDARYGPSLDVTYGVGLKALGSDDNLQRSSATGGWVFPWCDEGFVSLSASLAWRRQDGRFIDNTASGTLRIATPPIPAIGDTRIVSQTVIATRWNDTQNAFYAIGSDSGLRGFFVNQFYGQRLVSEQLEARTPPRGLWVFRVGGVLFYDVGGAADSLGELALHHDIGLGVRALVPQTSRAVFRFDLAFPLDGADLGQPKFIAAFDQAF